MSEKYELEVGVDVAKRELCASIRSKITSFPNSPAGIKLLFLAIKKAGGNARITCEATGSYQDLLVRSCLKKGVPISQCDPSQIKHYIKSFGQRAKTDPIDARYIADFATQRRPATLGKEWVKQLDMRELKRRQDFLTKQCAQCKTSLDSYQSSSIKADIRREIKAKEKIIAKHELKLGKLVDADPVLKKKRELMTSVVGIGERTSLALLMLLPELGTTNRRKIASLAGLAPMHRKSGTVDGARTVKGGGRKKVRTALYMASVSAIRHNPHIRAFYLSLKKRGKKGRAIVIAIARKLLIHLNGLLEKQAMSEFSS
jgi:transposase